jgi:hypothetical protein
MAAWFVVIRIEIAHFTAPVGLCGRSCPQSVVALPGLAKAAVIAAMSTKSREVIFGSRIRGANRAEGAREEAAKAIRAADRAEAEAWSIQMEGYGGPAQPSPTIGQCLNGGYGWLEVECNRCRTRASLPLDAIRRPRHTPIWKLEAALKCRSCKKGRYAPPVNMIKLTQEREITPYVWVHPDEESMSPACAGDPPMANVSNPDLSSSLMVRRLGLAALP